MPSSLNGRVSALETRYKAIQPGMTPAQQEHLALQQRHQYEVLCQVLALGPDELAYQDYLPVWYESSVVTYEIANWAPGWALRALAEMPCPLILQPLERFLQRPRHVDVLWPLDHQLIPGRQFAYQHFFQTIMDACFQGWPQLAVQWPTLDDDRRFQVLALWLTLHDPERCEWPDDTTDEQKLVDLKAILLHQYETYRRDVLHNEWHPPMTYHYRDNPAYFLQPSGWGVEGPLTVGPHGGGVHVDPVDDTKAAWQRQCGRQLATRWAGEVAADASEIDVQAWLASADEGEDAGS